MRSIVSLFFFELRSINWSSVGIPYSSIIQNSERQAERSELPLEATYDRKEILKTWVHSGRKNTMDM